MKLKSAVSAMGVALTALGLCLGAAAAPRKGTAPAVEHPALRVAVDIPEEYNAEDRLLAPRTLRNSDPRASFEVVIENVSLYPVLLLSGGSGSRYTLTVEVTDARGQTTVSRPIAFSKNVTYEQRLDPGEVQIRRVYYAAESNRLLGYT